MAAKDRYFTCNLCEALCGLEVAVTDAGVGAIRGDKDDVFSRGHICPKGPALRELYDDPDRLRAPVRRTASGWERVSWDDALGEIASSLRDVRARFGKDAVAFYVGNPTVHSHRAALGAQLMTAALGTKNRFDPNSQDSNPRLFACMQVYGDALAMPVPDVERTTHLLMLGANPAASNGSQMALGDVRARMQAIRERGGQVVLIDPRRTESAAWATSHHFIRPGGDAALLLAMLHVVFAEKRVVSSEVATVAQGLPDVRAIAARFPPERVAEAIGIDAETIRTLARDFATAPRACAYARVGVCQNELGPIACWLVEVLNVVTGNFDRVGGAMFSSPAADIAPLARLLVGNNYARWRSRVRGLPEFLGALPSAVMAEEMETPGDGQIKALVTFAGNPVSSTPNGERLARAIAKLDFVAAVDFYVNETTRHANVILPPMHVFESGNYDVILLRFGVRNVAKYSPPIVRPSDEARDDWDILSDLAMRIAGPDAEWARRAWRKIARGLPELAIDLLLRAGPTDLTLAKLRALPHGVDLGPLVPGRLRNVRTADGRARLAPPLLVADLARVEAWLADAREGLALVGRRHLRSNNSWMHNARSLVKGPDRARLMMHPLDADARGLLDGGRARVTSRTGEIVITVAVTTEIMPGVVSLPHGFGHQAVARTMRVAGALPGSSANVLTDEAFVEPLVGTSILNGVPVTVTSAEEK